MIGVKRKVTFEPEREKTYLLTCALNEDWNQSAHPRSLIRIFDGRMKKLCILGYPKCAQERFWSACATAQADLNLCWVHISESTFTDFVVLMCLFGGQSQLYITAVYQIKTSCFFIWECWTGLRNLLFSLSFIWDGKAITVQYFVYSRRNIQDTYST